MTSKTKSKKQEIIKRVPKGISIQETIWKKFKSFCGLRDETLEEGIERVLTKDNDEYMKTGFKG